MKKLYLIMIVIIMSLLFTSCVEIEDTNGEDTSLTTLTQEDFLSSSKSFSSTGSSTKTKSTTQTIFDSEYEDDEYDKDDKDDKDVDKVDFKCSSASGVDTLMKTRLNKGETIKVYCYTEIEAGNLEVVLISSENEIVHSFAINEEDTFDFEADEDGIYEVKIGCESFAGKIALKREIE